MKICFLQKQAFPYFGVMSLAGSLGPAGFESDALIANLEKDLLRSLKQLRPEVIAFSALSMEHSWLESTAALVKEAFPEIPVVVGGIHAMLYPEAVLAIPSVDFVCTGEGEETLVSLCRALREGASVSNLKGIGFRADGRAVINERDALLPDLGRSREDRGVYYRRYAVLRKDELKQFIASRGCPYHCAFCFNEKLHKLFPGQGGRVRMKDPVRLIEEIEDVRRQGPMKAVFFADDLFAADKAWLRDFGRLYQRRIGTPFMCITRADRMDDETADILKDAGCHTVSIGVESGNERLRTRLLKKTISNDQIRRCSAVLHARGIRVQTSNMFCLPDETLADAFETVRLNIGIQADFVFTPLFMPFPGTPLSDYCIEKGYLPRDFGFAHLPQSFMARSILRMPDRVRIENLQRIAYFLVRFPAFLPLGERMVARVTASWPYYPFLYAGTLMRYREERRLSWWGAARFLWRFRKSV